MSTLNDHGGGVPDTSRATFYDAHLHERVEAVANFTNRAVKCTLDDSGLRIHAVDMAEVRHITVTVDATTAAARPTTFLADADELREAIEVVRTEYGKVTMSVDHPAGDVVTLDHHGLSEEIETDDADGYPDPDGPMLDESRFTVTTTVDSSRLHAALVGVDHAAGGERTTAVLLSGDDGIDVARCDEQNAADEYAWRLSSDADITDGVDVRPVRSYYAAQLVGYVAAALPATTEVTVEHGDNYPLRVTVDDGWVMTVAPRVPDGDEVPDRD